ncbi:MAG: type II toxin-antitoxin system HicA family toxin [Gammaproteobacteria bacterium]|nr:type II toxin-antitoxin system HicA family toxin [Gammaproteobacteria bacterium]
MAKVDGLLGLMKANPKADWRPKDVRKVARKHNLTIRQRGTSHAVLTNGVGGHLTIPMHKPIKPFYIRQLVKLIEGAR